MGMNCPQSSLPAKQWAHLLQRGAIHSNFNPIYFARRVQAGIQSQRRALREGKGLIVQAGIQSKDGQTTAQQNQNMASAILGPLVGRLVDTLVQKAVWEITLGCEDHRSIYGEVGKASQRLEIETGLAATSDSEIECERLIELWIGEGFICTGKNESPWDEGWTYLNELMDRCLIQLCERFMSKLCKMHDLLRDLCLRISQEENKCVFEVGKQLEQFPPSLEKSLRRISLISTDIRAIPETNQFSGLRTLLLSDCNRIGNIPASLLSNLKSLRVLDLSWTSIKSLPKAVGNLKLLRVLDVSHTDIEGLPESVRGLKSLQLLDATGCRRLQRLPEGISELKCMRHLDADYCDKLEHIPKGVGKITCLEILRGVYSRSENGLRLEDLGDLTRLRDLQLKIKHELDLKCLAEGILGGFVKMRRLRIKNCLHLDVSDSVFPRLSERMPSFIELETLILNGFAVPNWICSFQNLIMIRFYQCECLDYPALETLPNFRHLALLTNNRCRLLPKEFGKSGGFPKLELLELNDFPNLEELPRIEEGGMPSLKTLDLYSLPLLKRMVEEGLELLTTLEELSVVDCGEWEEATKEGGKGHEMRVLPKHPREV
eukprot:Gb_26463 [translate_table: standard]